MQLSSAVLYTSLTLAPPTLTLRSWLSDYNQARDYIRQEQARFNKAAQQLAPLQQQLLSELRRHVRAYQVWWPAGRFDCTLPQPTHTTLPCTSSVQADDPAEADGPYLYRTTFTPAGSQTVTRVSSSCPDQPEQVVVSDDLIRADLAQAPGLTTDLQGECTAVTAEAQAPGGVRLIN